VVGSLRVVEVHDRARWNAAVLAAPRADLLQSWEWGEFKRQTGGWQPLRLAALSGNELVAGAQVLARSLLGARFLYLPRGPWWRDWLGVEALVRYLRRREAPRAPLLRADPPLASADQLAGVGFRPAPRQFQPRATIVVDLTPAPDEILARFNSQVRYNARLAERKGVEVVVGGASEVEEFWKLYAATAGRKGFEWRALSYFARLVAVFGDAADVVLGRRAGETLAGAIILRFGQTAYYLYGASGGDRSVKPAELVQHRAMLWARDRGATRYDMWGVPAHPTEDNPLYGVYRFKSGFGGQEEVYVGALDLPLIPLVPWAPALAESLALKTRALLHGEGFRILDHLA
jgi:lipid II:glycine glycyltransferase (peptidoglycan interpeptide bridge formation enzyme)